MESPSGNGYQIPLVVNQDLRNRYVICKTKILVCLFLGWACIYVCHGAARHHMYPVINSRQQPPCRYVVSLRLFQWRIPDDVQISVVWPKISRGKLPGNGLRELTFLAGDPWINWSVWRSRALGTRLFFVRHTICPKGRWKQCEIKYDKWR